MKRLIAATIAGTLALQPMAASAQSETPTPAQIEAATLYAMPHLFKGFNATCSGSLASDGFVATNRDRLTEKFALAAEGSWAGAKEALMQIASQQGGGDGADIFSKMPDESLRPFVDGILFALVSSELKPEMCSDVERGLELLDPMPVENMAGLIGFGVELMERDKAKKQAKRKATIMPPPRPSDD